MKAKVLADIILKHPEYEVMAYFDEYPNELKVYGVGIGDSDKILVLDCRVSENETISLCDSCIHNIVCGFGTQEDCKHYMDENILRNL